MFAAGIVTCDTVMQVTALHSSSASRAEMREILADYLALDRARVFRRLFLVRFGSLAAIAAVVTLVIPGLSIAARCLPPALFLTPPVWAWAVELKRARRLAVRLRQTRLKKS
jgi:hypothetical protein